MVRVSCCLVLASDFEDEVCLALKQHNYIYPGIPYSGNFGVEF